MPAPVSPDGAEITVLHWIIGGISGFFGAVGAGFLATWRVATFTNGIRVELAQQRKDLSIMENELAAIITRQDRRHEDQDRRHQENQDAIHALEVVLARQPDKDDFRRLADYVRASSVDLKQFIESRTR